MPIDLTRLKSLITCVDYAQRNSLPIHKPGDRCISPMRSDAINKTAFVVYDNFYYDFTTRTGGDVIDLSANLNHNGNRGEAIRELSQLCGLSDDNFNAKQWHTHIQNTCNLIQLWHESLTAEHREYFRSRNITDETINRLKIGYTGKGTQTEHTQSFAAHRYSFPYWKNNYICNWTTRSSKAEQNPKYLKSPNTSYTDTSAIWGLHTLSYSDKLPLVICEGTFDALSFEQEHYPVLATMGGGFTKDQLSELTAIARQFPYVLLAFDNDTAGQQFTLKLSKYLFSHKIPFQVLEIPKPHKDVSDYYSAAHLLPDKHIPGLINLSSQLSDKNDFKAFILDTARYTSKPELAELFTVAQEQHSFPAEWFAELRKLAFSPPSEDNIAKLIIKNHKLKYISQLGFYEYSKGYWQQRVDEIIQSYIAEELGYYRTGSRITSILKLVKADTITAEMFNQKPLFNFINGTLELTPPYNFRNHSPEDLCSMQVDYPYNPTSQCPQWLSFISSVSDSDPKREALLQEMSGYVLYSDCSLQKCFFLLGDGANGKSVLLDILSKIFGNKSISNVELSALVADFQRIQLLHSILNISSETKTDVKGAEAIFKQVVAGDMITACYKNKDFINFRSRSKLIFSCNEIIAVKDLTFGFERRMCFIKFMNKYLENPGKNNPHELPLDRDITEKLSKELSGIFNWAFDGYKTLRSLKSFTQTDDSDDLMQNFKETINPIVCFIDENPLEERISNADLYAIYRQWCYDAGHSPTSRTKFIQNFKKSIPKNYTEYRTNSERGFTIVNKNNTDSTVELL